MSLIRLAQYNAPPLGPKFFLRAFSTSFIKDSTQEHNRNAAANLSILRKIALSLLKAIDPSKKLKIKLKESAYSPSFRSRCLLGQF